MKVEPEPSGTFWFYIGLGLNTIALYTYNANVGNTILYSFFIFIITVQGIRYMILIINIPYTELVIGIL